MEAFENNYCLEQVNVNSNNVRTVCCYNCKLLVGVTCVPFHLTFLFVSIKMLSFYNPLAVHTIRITCTLYWNIKARSFSKPICFLSFLKLFFFVNVQDCYSTLIATYISRTATRKTRNKKHFIVRVFAMWDFKYFSTVFRENMFLYSQFTEDKMLWL